MAKQSIPKIFNGYQLVRSNPDGQIISTMHNKVMDDVYIRALEPLFEKALCEKDVTAWVCADGQQAVVAFSFLKSRHIGVPGNISLIGIEDSMHTMLKGISVYDFNLDRMGYLAAHVVLGDIPVRRNRKGIVEYGGKIIERGSVRRA